jgi:hypothetical protein
MSTEEVSATSAAKKLVEYGAGRLSYELLLRVSEVQMVALSDTPTNQGGVLGTIITVVWLSLVTLCAVGALIACCLQWWRHLVAEHLPPSPRARRSERSGPAHGRQRSARAWTRFHEVGGAWPEEEGGETFAHGGETFAISEGSTSGVDPRFTDGGGGNGLPPRAIELASVRLNLPEPVIAGTQDDTHGNDSGSEGGATERSSLVGLSPRGDPSESSSWSAR